MSDIPKHVEQTPQDTLSAGEPESSTDEFDPLDNARVVLEAVGDRSPEEWTDVETDMYHAMQALARQSKHQDEQDKEIKRLSQEALIDTVTGLKNRRAFEGEITEEVKAVNDSRRAGMALMLLDLNLFKPINDTFGHPAGDEVLRRVAKKLSLFSRGGTDGIYRLGGDEFGIMLRDFSIDGDQAEKMLGQRKLEIETLLRAEIMQAAMELAAQQGKIEPKGLNYVGASVAFGIFRSGETPTDLVTRVDDELGIFKDEQRSKPSHPGRG